MPEQSWTGSLHQTFRLLGEQSKNLAPFLQSNGLTESEVLKLLPYDAKRSKSATGTPDPKRYRDGRQVYQTAGLLYEADDGRIRVTDLGNATLRWLPIITPANSIILARHAAYALSACQLRNPSGSGAKYSQEMVVFPFQFIWRAMLALDDEISSDELNRGIFKVKNEEELQAMIDAIRKAREAHDVKLLGDEVVTGEAKNDRIIPWMSLASFGWTLFPDKRGGKDEKVYQIPPRSRALLKEASSIKRRHREFDNVGAYVECISAAACLPKDLR